MQGDLFFSPDGCIEGVVDALLGVAREIDLLKFLFNLDVGIDQDHIFIVNTERLLLNSLQIGIH